MDRKPWIIAARLLQKHGADDALTIVQRRLGALHRGSHGGYLRGTDVAQFTLWRQIARAVLEIVREAPRGPYQVH